jgi:hypothetical protein
MRAKKPSQGREIKTPALRLISGSDDEDFTRILVTQVDTSLWVEHSDSEQRDRQFNAAITAMKGMKPGDELEGMLSAQLIAIHNAAMECCRRAMLGTAPPLVRKLTGWEDYCEGERSLAAAIERLGNV